MARDTTNAFGGDSLAGCYQVLQLPPGSDLPQIHAQYRRLAMQHHPDRNPERREWAEEQLRRLNEAYRMLAQRDALLPPANPLPPTSPAASAAFVPAPPPRAQARRAARYAAVIGAVCAVSVGYANWSQPPLSSSALTSPPSSASSLPAPASEGAAAPLPVLAAAPASVSAPIAPADKKQAALAAQFAEENVGVNALVTQAAQMTVRVDKETQHIPQSRRTQKAEQLAADALELSRLQHTVQDGLVTLRSPSSAALTQDLRRGQVADLQLSLFQLGRQRQTVRAELAAFPAK